MNPAASGASTRVQYSDPNFPAMIRRIASRAWHSGQCDSTAAEGDWGGSVSISIMGCAICKIGSERFQAKSRPVRVKKTRQIKNPEPRFDSIETEKALGCRLFRLRYLAGCRVALQLELVDLGLRVRDGGLGVVPGKADFERGKRNAIDDHGVQVRPPDTGVPKAFSSLESLDFKAVMVALHVVAPAVFRVEG